MLPACDVARCHRRISAYQSKHLLPLDVGRLSFFSDSGFTAMATQVTLICQRSAERLDVAQLCMLRIIYYGRALSPAIQIK